MSTDPARIDAVHVAAVTAFADMAGFRVVDEGDLLRTEAPEWPFTFLNGVARLSFDADRLDARVATIEAHYRSLGLPLVWWVTPGSAPPDVGARLAGVGLEVSETDETMVIDLAPWPDAVEAASARVPAGLRIIEVADDHDLRDWIAAFMPSYGRTDPRREAVMAELYDARTAPLAGRHQLLARLDGVPVAAASLFVSDEVAWVTNIGTVPSARGQGIGGAITARCLALAVELGHAEAWLGASPMGRPVYERLGFRPVGPMTGYRSVRDAS